MSWFLLFFPCCHFRKKKKNGIKIKILNFPWLDQSYVVRVKQEDWCFFVAKATRSVRRRTVKKREVQNWRIGVSSIRLNKYSKVMGNLFFFFFFSRPGIGCTIRCYYCCYWFCHCCYWLCCYCFSHRVQNARNAPAPIYIPRNCQKTDHVLLSKTAHTCSRTCR